jgi:hypothetical protein
MDYGAAELLTADPAEALFNDENCDVSVLAHGPSYDVARIQFANEISCVAPKAFWHFEYDFADNNIPTADDNCVGYRVASEIIKSLLFTHSLTTNSTQVVVIVFTMKVGHSVTLAALLLANSSEAFTSRSCDRSVSTSTTLFGYVPSGFTPESYKKFKEEEAKKKVKANLGGVGPRGFKSRSMQSFQEAMERGEAAHLLPVMNAKERVAKGELRPEDIPYMQRGGSWDNSDVKGAKKKRWLASDKDYASGGYRKEQSVSIFGYGEGLDWTGKNARKGPSPESVIGAAPKFGRNYKAPNIKDMSKDSGNDKKKFLGLF